MSGKISQLSPVAEWEEIPENQMDAVHVAAADVFKIPLYEVEALSVEEVLEKIGRLVDEYTDNLTAKEGETFELIKFIQLLQLHKPLELRLQAILCKYLLLIFNEENASIPIMKLAVTLLNQSFLHNRSISSWLSKDEQLEGSVQIFGRKLMSIGDYDCQTTVFEAMCIIASNAKNKHYWTDIWFLNETIRSLFLLVSPTCFERDMRRTLNFINMSDENPRVFSHVALSVFFGERMLKKPHGCDFWIDFNLDSHRISFYCSDMENDEASGMWDTVIIPSDGVEKCVIECNPSTGHNELSITLYSSFDDSLAASKSQAPKRNSSVVKMIFWNFLEINSTVTEIFGASCVNDLTEKLESGYSSNVEVHPKAALRKSSQLQEIISGDCEATPSLVRSSISSKPIDTVNRRKISQIDTEISMEHESSLAFNGNSATEFPTLVSSRKQSCLDASIISEGWNEETFKKKNRKRKREEKNTNKCSVKSESISTTQYGLTSMLNIEDKSMIPELVILDESYSSVKDHLKTNTLEKNQEENLNDEVLSNSSFQVLDIPCEEIQSDDQGGSLNQTAKRKSSQLREFPSVAKHASDSQVDKSQLKKIRLYNPDTVPLYDSSPRKGKKSPFKDNMPPLGLNHLILSNKRKSTDSNEKDHEPKKKPNNSHGMANIVGIENQSNVKRVLRSSSKKSLEKCKKLLDDEESILKTMKRASAHEKIIKDYGNSLSIKKKSQPKRRRRKNIFNTDTETLGSSEVSWFNKKNVALFETPKKQYSRRKKTARNCSNKTRANGPKTRSRTKIKQGISEKKSDSGRSKSAYSEFSNVQLHVEKKLPLFSKEISAMEKLLKSKKKIAVSKPSNSFHSYISDRNMSAGSSNTVVIEQNANRNEMGSDVFENILNDSFYKNTAKENTSKVTDKGVKGTTIPHKYSPKSDEMSIRNVTMQTQKYVSNVRKQENRPCKISSTKKKIYTTDTRTNNTSPALESKIRNASLKNTTSMLSSSSVLVPIFFETIIPVSPSIAEVKYHEKGKKNRLALKSSNSEVEINHLNATSKASILQDETVGKRLHMEKFLDSLSASSSLDKTLTSCHEVNSSELDHIVPVFHSTPLKANEKLFSSKFKRQNENPLPSKSKRQNENSPTLMSKRQKIKHTKDDFEEPKYAVNQKISYSMQASNIGSATVANSFCSSLHSTKNVRSTPTISNKMRHSSKGSFVSKSKKKNQNTRSSSLFATLAGELSSLTLKLFGTVQKQRFDVNSKLMNLRKNFVSLLEDLITRNSHFKNWANPKNTVHHIHNSLKDIVAAVEIFFQSEKKLDEKLMRAHKRAFQEYHESANLTKDVAINALEGHILSRMKLNFESFFKKIKNL